MPARKRRLCLRGHDTLICGRAGGRCCQCNRDRNRVWRKQNPEKQAHVVDPERERARLRALYWSNPERSRARGRRSAAQRLIADPTIRTRLAAASRRSYRNNYEENKARARERMRLWSAANRETTRQRTRARRAAKGGAGGSVDLGYLSLLFEAQSARCSYCHAPLGADRHLDHRVPLSRGGRHTSDNVCWACARCNLSKHDHLYPSEWTPMVA